MLTGCVQAHGHTYQNHPIVSAAALEVQKIIERDGLLNNVRTQGEFLGSLLRQRLGKHPHVGDIRGRGLFWGIEFVTDKNTKEPFDISMQVARRIHELALNHQYQLLVYHGQGCAGGGRGDHIMVCPAYTVTKALVEAIVERLVVVIETFFGDV